MILVRRKEWAGIMNRQHVQESGPRGKRGDGVEQPAVENPELKNRAAHGSSLLRLLREPRSAIFRARDDV
jgi:hypothetical protein